MLFPVLEERIERNVANLPVAYWNLIKNVSVVIYFYPIILLHSLIISRKIGGEKRFFWCIKLIISF